LATSTITVGGQPVTLVSFPTAPGLKAYDFQVEDKVGTVPSVFTGQVQAQSWPGADMWSATLTVAPRNLADGDDWISFLMELRGMANAFQLGDVTKATPRGSVAGTPLIDNSALGGNAAMSYTLSTKGWTASAAGVLRRGDQVQAGYRMYQSLADVDADASGKATFPVWPSLREVPVDASPVIIASPQALWRLAVNLRGYSRDITRLTKLGPIKIQEYR
jgi:hypothetical protein